MAIPLLLRIDTFISPILTYWKFLVRKIFADLMSLWKTFFLWRVFRAWII